MGVTLVVIIRFADEIFHEINHPAFLGQPHFCDYTDQQLLPQTIPTPATKSLDQDLNASSSTTKSTYLGSVPNGFCATKSRDSQTKMGTYYGWLRNPAVENGGKHCLQGFKHPFFVMRDF